MDTNLSRRDFVRLGGVTIVTGVTELLLRSIAFAQDLDFKIYLPIILKNSTGEVPFPELHVEGPYIKERDGTYVEFKGAHVYTFLEGGYTFDKAKYYIDLAKQWGSNFIRFMLDFGIVNLDEVKKAVDYIASKRMFCLLCPNSLNEIGLRNPTYQQEEFNQLLAFTDVLVRKFQYKTNVMYQLLGEPGPVEVAPGDWRYVTWAEWAPWARKLATAIRNVRSDVLIGLPGVMWGRDFSDFKDHPELFPFDNFFCTVDYYRWFLNPGTPQEVEITPDTSEWDWMIGRYPIFFPEIGVPDNMGGRNHWADDDAIKFILGKVENNPYMLHVAAFEMGPFDWRTSLVKDANGTPSSRGQPYYDNYRDPNSTCPPTTF